MKLAIAVSQTTPCEGMNDVNTKIDRHHQKAHNTSI